MKEMILFASTVVMGFFAIMNPIGNTPIYLGLVMGLDEKAKRRVARKAVVLAFFIVAVFTIGGGIIFKLFGITLPAFQIAGGILVFLVGYELLHGRESAMHHPPAGESGESEGAAEDVAITPLALPILAGPGTISTAMNFAGAHSGYLYNGVVVAVFALMCAVTYVCFISGEKLVARMGRGVIKVVTRLMGLILTVISVQMVIAGVVNIVKMYG